MQLPEKVMQYIDQQVDVLQDLIQQELNNSPRIAAKLNELAQQGLICRMVHDTRVGFVVSADLEVPDESEAAVVAPASLAAQDLDAMFTSADRNWLSRMG